MKIKVNTYAALKDYFDDSFEVEMQTGASVSDIIKLLILLNPESKLLLEKCRFAINREFIAGDAIINPDDFMDVLPPSSGG